MDRRKFIQAVSVTAAFARWSRPAHASGATLSDLTSLGPVPDVTGHTVISRFTLDDAEWEVHEDLRTRDGEITFISPRGARVLPKSAEGAFAEADTPHLGLSMEEIGLSGPDLLADRLLAGGDDPDPETVKKAAPPQGSFMSASAPGAPAFQARPRWDTFVGTKPAYDTMPVYPAGNTRTYHPNQYFGQIRGEAVSKRFDGLVGGWMPAIRKVMPLESGSYVEVVVFGDVEAPDKFIVQTWHRTAEIKDGKIVRAVYGHSYPAFPPARQDPKPEEFYRALLIFAARWERELHDFAVTALPENSWVHMAKHSFAKELIVRPGGVYPKYGAVDRDYYGSEYDGFQDIFTSATYTNLEWGRFEQARLIVDNYFSDFVDAKGMINMRGPETAQFGLTLSLLARYYNYTRDAELLRKHRGKLTAMAKLLMDMHDESLKRPADDPGRGLIHGWSESDACLASTPEIWWQPYYANSAFAARGLKDLARAWQMMAQSETSAAMQQQSATWLERSRMLREATVASMEKDIWRDQKPPYIAPLPGTKLMFRDAMAKERPSPQQWPHRPYTELLQADILPANLANMVVDTMRAYGATTLGVVANVSPARAGSRAILGFISYGYAQMLLRLDRVEEYLLFLYSHRYHGHTRGSWVAGEVSGINGGTALFCIPAQQTIPLLVRWMLVLEDSDKECLYFGKGLPRAWVGSGRPVQINQAPTRWGHVNFHVAANPTEKSVIATVELAAAGSPAQIEIKLRMPKGTPLQRVTANGRPATLEGPHGDTVVIATEKTKHFDVVGEWK